MKRLSFIVSVLLSVSAVIISCDGVDPEGPVTPVGPDEPGPEVPVEDHDANSSSSRQATVTLTPFGQLNATKTVNSHKGLTDKSAFCPIYGTYTNIDIRTTGFNSPLYPRLVQCNDGTWLMTCHYGDGGASAGNEVFIMKSSDLVNWSEASYLFQCTGGKPFYAGAHLLKLSDGRIMASAAYRKTSGDYHYNFNDNGIVLKFSSDNGKTWTGDQRINVGTCWEPMAVELPSGRIQIYYTDCNHIITDVWKGPAAYGGSGVAMIYSDDKGKTWLPVNQNHLHVIRQEMDFKNGYHLYTDQMPAVVVLNDGTQLAAALESDKGMSKGKSDFHISFAYSDDLDSWSGASSEGSIPADRSDMAFVGGAPYLVTFPSGETVLTYNTDFFCMRIGNEKARDFGKEQLVFGADSESRGYWGAAAAVSDHILAACVGGSNDVLQLGQFYLNHAIEASSSTITVDGDNSDWADNSDSFVLCSKGPVYASLRVAQDSDRLYFLVEVPDGNLSSSDYFQVFLSSSSSMSLSETSIRIKGNAKGLVESDVFTGYWKKSPMSVNYCSRYDGTPNDASDADTGYVAEFSVPRSSVKIVSGCVLANFSLKDADNSTTSEDALSPVSGNSTENWIPVIGL